MNSDVQKLHDWIDQHEDLIVESLRGVLRIPSLKGEPAPRAPYGTEPRKALDYTLTLCEELGFNTKDLDGHAMHAEMGAGTEMVAALGHLDVVPAGGQWEHDPFGAEIDNCFIYARGASDDKGPTYAALFGAKAIMESGLPLSRRIRIIFGCDEESGFGCVKHYWETAKEERPVLAFTPDAMFPLVYAEKGISNLILSTTPKSIGNGAQLNSFSGGLRANMVPDSAEAEIEGTAEQLAKVMTQLNRWWDNNVTYTHDGNSVTVTAKGKSAHGSTPEEGSNAVCSLAKVLQTLDLSIDTSWLTWLGHSGDPTGAAIGISGRDDVAGPLTSNLGIFNFDGTTATATFNIRYPVTWAFDTMIDRHLQSLQGTGWELTDKYNQAALYVPLDTEPAKTLMRVYREETGDQETKPFTMGGGTYARATPNAVAFGAAFPDGVDGPAHEPDERISVNNYLKAAKIYAHALYEMAK